MPGDLRAAALVLAAAFLALALGVVVGATRADGVLQAGQEAALRRLEAEFAVLRGELRALRARAEADRQLLEGLARLAVAGRLEGWAVRVAVVGGDARAREEARALTRLLRDAGASPVEAVVLRELPRDPEQAARWGRALAGGLPAAGPPGAALAAREAAGPAPAGPGDPGAPLVPLDGRAPHVPLAPVDAVVLVRALEAGDEAPAQPLTQLVAALDAAGVRVVVYAPWTRDGSLRGLRRLGVSSVEGLEGPAGRAAAIWAVAGASGRFGVGWGTEGLLPAPGALGP